MPDNELKEYFLNNSGRKMHKWMHYFEIYDKYFRHFRGKSVNILEFGVSHGGSLQMWKHYFGGSANIYGIDINPECKKFEEDRVKIYIGDQEDRDFLQTIKSELPSIDILIDDGGHTMQQQINTFEELFPHISEDGVYLCEDLHTSYWADFGGGFRHPGNFIEYSKSYIDDLNAWHSRDKESFRISEFTRTAYSMHYYDSVLVIEKRKMQSPSHHKTGKKSF